MALSERAGKPLWIPDDVRGLCCSTPWSSKGYKRGQTWMSEQMSDALWRWSDGGKLPVVVDAASCTLGLKDDMLEHLDDERRDRLKLITIIDSIAWCKDLLPSLYIHKTIPKILVHPTCSTTHLGLSETLLEIASALADSAEIPLGTTCCGTAGDRGLLHPELVHSATRDTIVQIQSSGDDTCFVSANRTCELGMRQTTGKVYESFIYALEEARACLSDSTRTVASDAFKARGTESSAGELKDHVCASSILKHVESPELPRMKARAGMASRSGTTDFQALCPS